MNRSTGLKKVRRIARRIAKAYKPEKIILFGSYAWGKPTRDSDFDVLIVKKGARNYFREQARVRDLIDGEIAADLLIHTPEKLAQRVRWGDFFYEDILQKGLVLYGR